MGLKNDIDNAIAAERETPSERFDLRHRYEIRQSLSVEEIQELAADIVSSINQRAGRRTYDITTAVREIDGKYYFLVGVNWT